MHTARKHSNALHRIARNFGTSPLSRYVIRSKNLIYCEALVKVIAGVLLASNGSAGHQCKVQVHFFPVVHDLQVFVAFFSEVATFKMCYPSSDAALLCAALRFIHVCT